MSRKDQEKAEGSDNGRETLAGEIVAGILTREWRACRKATTDALDTGLSNLAELHAEVADLLSELHVQAIGRRPSETD